MREKTIYTSTTETYIHFFSCPVCNQNLADLGNAAEQEAHVKNCLEGGAGSVPQSAKYLVYKLPGESPLVGIECVICLEEFMKG